MFDNRWDNWAGDFAESFAATLLNPAIRGHLTDILRTFGDGVKAIDPAFPDKVRPGTFAKVMSTTMTRLALLDAGRTDVPEVIGRFFEYLQESGKIADGEEWAGQIRNMGNSPPPKSKAEVGDKGLTIRNPANVSPLGRNDPCPCGSGKKFKKCCKNEP